MGEPIQRCPGQSFTAEHLGPVLERQVGGHDHTGPFVCGADHIKEQFSSELAGGDVSEFIEDQQVQLGQLGFQASQLSLLPGFDHLRHQLDDLVEADPFATSAGLHAQGSGQVRLARAGAADQQEVLRYWRGATEP